MHTRIPCVLLLLILFLSGCSGWSFSQRSSPAGDAGDASFMRLIAVDFTTALRQLPEVAPSLTTVHFLRSSRHDSFTRQLRETLQQAGYGTRWVDEGNHPALFRYRREPPPEGTAAGPGTYEIAIGQIEMRRQYVVDDSDRLWPSTPLYVRGAEAGHLQLDDAHFVEAARASPTGASAIDSNVLSALPTFSGHGSASDTVSAAAPASTSGVDSRQMAPGSGLNLAREANPLDPLIAGSERQQPGTLPLISLPRMQNVFERGTSNYQDLLAGHRVVRRQVLTFANDSLLLGEVNKQLVEQMVESFRFESDVFSVLGCSLGPTKLKSGNAALALGRASRVREALLFAGVPQDRILDEGCWAGDGSDKSLPRRGVVLTLNRRI